MRDEHETRRLVAATNGDDDDDDDASAFREGATRVATHATHATHATPDAATCPMPGPRRRFIDACACARKRTSLCRRVVAPLLLVVLASSLVAAAGIKAAFRRLPTLQQTLTRRECAANEACDWCSVAPRLSAVPLPRRVSVVGPPAHDAQRFAGYIERATRVPFGSHYCVFGGGVLDPSCTSAMFAQHVSAMVVATLDAVALVPGYAANDGAVVVLMMRDPRESAVLAARGADFATEAMKHARQVRDHWRAVAELRRGGNRTTNPALLLRYDVDASEREDDAELRAATSSVLTLVGAGTNALPSLARMMRCIPARPKLSATRRRSGWWRSSFAAHVGLLRRFCDEIGEEWREYPQHQWWGACDRTEVV